MTDASQAVDIFSQAAECNRQDPLLAGSMLVFPDYGQLVMTGDLHGHRRNFDRLVNFCGLDHSTIRHLVLHEIIHEDLIRLDDVDRSHRVLLEAARLKIEYPDQVHFLQSNHELGQITGHDITKGGRSSIQAFEEGVAKDHGSDAPAVLEAITAFIRSYPLAGRTQNRVFLSHSLPAPRHMKHFDPSVFERTPTQQDLTDNGSGYVLVWGRKQTADQLQELAEMLDVDLFINGHQPQETGYGLFHDRQLILASEHNLGMFLPFDLKRRMTIEELVDMLRPLSAIA